MRNKLTRIVLETKKMATITGDAARGFRHVDVELVLDALPRRPIGRVLVAILPNRAPAGEHGRRGRGSDLLRRRQSALNQALNHKSVRLLVEGVELGRDMRLGANAEGRLVNRALVVVD